MLLARLVSLIRELRNFAKANMSLAALGFTHFQPAQPTTVGKRACLWINELIMDYESLEQFYQTLPFRGVKGTTGTQASYLALFNGDHEKVKKLDGMVSQKMGFSRVIPVTGQTYSRKIDAQVVAVLSGIAQSLHKMANDIRLLQHLKEIEEPFESKQVGSSAMAYKRNPMRSERLTSLCRYIISLSQSPAMTAAEQWFERTLDDSANKRLSIPESFLACDASLIIATNICSGLVVYPKVIAKRLGEELPFMATENIIMAAVRKGGDRQELHERIRQHAHEAGRKIKLEGSTNDLQKRIMEDPLFENIKEDIQQLMEASNFIGRAPQQVQEFLDVWVDPLLEKAASYGTITIPELKV